MLVAAGLETTMSKSARRLQGITGFAALPLEIQADALTSASCAAGQCDGGESHRHHEGSEQTHSGMIPPAWHALMDMPTVFSLPEAEWIPTPKCTLQS